MKALNKKADELLANTPQTAIQALRTDSLALGEYVNECKVASVPDDLWELWLRLRQLTDEPGAVRKLWLLAQKELETLPPQG